MKRGDRVRLLREQPIFNGARYAATPLPAGETGYIAGALRDDLRLVHFNRVDVTVAINLDNLEPVVERPNETIAFFAWVVRWTRDTGQPPNERDAFNEGLRQGYDAAMKDLHNGETK